MSSEIFRLSGLTTHYAVLLQISPHLLFAASLLLFIPKDSVLLTEDEFSVNYQEYGVQNKKYRSFTGIG